MAGPAPKTQSWTARENTQQDQLVLLVSGQVQVGNTSLLPALAEGGPLRDPHTLNLELTIEETGHPGTDVEVWMPVSFKKDVGADQFHDVVVRWDGTKIEQFPVIDDSEHSALMDKQSKAQNTVVEVVTDKPVRNAAKKAAKKAVKKAAPKQATPKQAAKAATKKAAKKASKKAPKKAGPRGVGGWAKGATKKAAKKAAKKVARQVKKTKKAKKSKKKGKR